MFCQAGFDQWLTTIKTHLPHLSKPQATVLALWSGYPLKAGQCMTSATSHACTISLPRPRQGIDVG